MVRAVGADELYLHHNDGMFQKTFVLPLFVKIKDISPGKDRTFLWASAGSGSLKPHRSYLAIISSGNHKNKSAFERARLAEMSLSMGV